MLVWSDAIPHRCSPSSEPKVEAKSLLEVHWPRRRGIHSFACITLPEPSCRPMIAATSRTASNTRLCRRAALVVSICFIDGGAEAVSINTGELGPLASLSRRRIWAACSQVRLLDAAARFSCLDRALAGNLLHPRRPTKPRVRDSRGHPLSRHGR